MNHIGGGGGGHFITVTQLQNKTKPISTFPPDKMKLALEFTGLRIILANHKFIHTTVLESRLHFKVIYTPLIDISWHVADVG